MAEAASEDEGIVEIGSVRTVARPRCRQPTRTMPSEDPRHNSAPDEARGLARSSAIDGHLHLQKIPITPLVPADLAACLALDAASLGGLWTPEQWRVELQDPQRPGVGLRQGERLRAMACGWLVLEELDVTLVAVDPRHRGLGLGRLVLEALLSTGRGLGAERATLEVSAVNAAALGLYARCGFHTAGVRRGYYRDGSDALIQWVDLGFPAGGDTVD